MSKICYLFGAGASANVLPVINQINERVRLMIQTLSERDPDFTEEKIHHSAFTNKENLVNVIEDLNWLINLLEKGKGLTVDQIAFELNKPPHEDYDKLRKIIAVYFAIEQLFNGVDYRYRAFFRCLLKPNYDFKKEIKILTWNYDSQIEMAFSGLLNTNDLGSIRRNIGFRTKMVERPHEMREDSFVYQLNGSATYYQSKGFRRYYFFDEISENPSLEEIALICNLYRTIEKKNDTHSGISYRFDNYFEDKELEKEVLQSTAATEKLVIVGYSLPFYNDDLDKLIIENMKYLKKIYIQAPDAIKLKVKLENLLGEKAEKVEIVTETNTSNFLLPNEI